MPAGHGGKRPGSGRKPRDVADWRRRMEQTLASLVSEDDVAHVVNGWLLELKAGNKDALWLVPYLFGRVPAEVKQEVTGAGGGPLRVQSFDYGAALASVAGGPEDDP